MRWLVISRLLSVPGEGGDPIRVLARLTLKRAPICGGLGPVLIDALAQGV